MARVNKALNRLALEVKAAYVLARSDWESVRVNKRIQYLCPKVYNGTKPVVTEDGVVLQKGKLSVWMKLADWFHRAQENPTDYINFQFTLAAVSRRAPEPLELVNAKAVAEWDKVKVNRLEDTKTLYKIQLEIIEREASMLVVFEKETLHDALCKVLMDPHVKVSGLFRYCEATRRANDSQVTQLKQQFELVARMFFPDAVLQFSKDRDMYVQAWRNFLPPGFIEKACKAHQTLKAKAVRGIR